MMLEVSHLRVTLHDGLQAVPAVADLSFHMDAGDTLGIVGESGAGKSTAAHTLMGLLRQRAEIGGKAAFLGEDLLHMPAKRLREMQGKELAIVFQEPMTSLDPTMRVGPQVEEALRLHTHLSARARRAAALEAMRLAELPNPAQIYRCYPFALSGGMRQRVMLASALVLHPKLLIADEPTTALDVTVQAQLLDTLARINRTEKTAILLISHDLGVVRTLCRRVLVMQGGYVVESGTVEDVFHHPQHAYTRALLAARPQIGAAGEETDAR